MSDLPSRILRRGRHRWLIPHSSRHHIVIRGLVEALRPAASLSSATEIFKRVVNLDRVIGDKTVGPSFDALGLTKKSFHVRQPALPANERTEPLGVELVRYRLHDISRRRRQDAGSAKPEGKRVGSITVVKWIGGINRRSGVNPELITQR